MQEKRTIISTRLVKQANDITYSQSPPKWANVWSIKLNKQCESITVALCSSNGLWTKSQNLQKLACSWFLISIETKVIWTISPQSWLFWEMQLDISMACETWSHISFSASAAFCSNTSFTVAWFKYSLENYCTESYRTVINDNSTISSWTFGPDKSCEGIECQWNTWFSEKNNPVYSIISSKMIGVKTSFSSHYCWKKQIF